VDFLEHLERFAVAMLTLPYACETHGGSQLERSGAVPAGYIDGLVKARLCLVSFAAQQEELPLEAMELGFGEALPAAPRLTKPSPQPQARRS